MFLKPQLVFKVGDSLNFYDLDLWGQLTQFNF